MANNVNNSLAVVQISEEGQKVWDSIMARIDALPDNKHLTGLFYEADSDGYWITPEGVYAGDAVGAKWAYPYDYDDCYINIESAWGPVIPFAEYIAEEIGKVDPDVRLVMTYEDEMPNFIGVTTFTADGIDTDNCLDADDVQEYLFEQHPDIGEMWDEDEGDWKEGKEDDAWDAMSEVQWDVYNQWQEENTEWSAQ
jgi:hypothetical protein